MIQKRFVTLYQVTFSQLEIKYFKFLAQCSSYKQKVPPNQIWNFSDIFPFLFYIAYNIVIKGIPFQKDKGDGFFENLTKSWSVLLM